MLRSRGSQALYRVLSFACFALLLVLAGCGATLDKSASASTSNNVTVTIVASDATISSGGSSSLTVVAANATTVKITGSDGSSYSMPAGGGTQVVSPTVTTTYTATATAGPTTVTAAATVTVNSTAPAGAPTVSIAANPASITAGSTSTLTVTATNATTVTVTGTDNSSYTLQATGGMQAVTPTATTTYTATATGSGGTISHTTIVTVTAPVANAPTVTIAANPPSITAGGSSTLTVTATNSDQVIVSGSDGKTYTLPGNGGTQAVSPAATTTYTATASGGGGSATSTATVTVTAPQAQPTVSISANPAAITAGSASVLTVAATNAISVLITGSDGNSYTLAPTGGTQSVSPAANTTYTATATGGPGTTAATATATVTVVAAPPPADATVTITANPTTIAAGQSSTLTIAATNATTVVVSGSDGTSYTLPPAGGTQVVTPAVTVTYTVNATGTGTPATASAIVTVTQPTTPTVTIAANPASITSGSSSTLTVTATNAVTVTISGSDGSSYTLQPAGGTQVVTPAASTTYTATATGNGSGPSNTATGTATVTVTAPGSVQSVNHVVFMLQENHSFDNYFGMLNPYRHANGLFTGDDGKDYEVDGIDDKLATISNQSDGPSSQTFHPFKLATTCVDDMSSSWLESYGDVNRYNFLANRPVLMDGFVHNAEGFAKACAASGTCSGQFTDLAGQRAMGYYDQDVLNYSYYMASQFAVSNRWFSPMSSKSIPNRIATFTGGTTQGLTLDPGNDDHLSQLDIPTIFQELDQAKVSWKVYYTVTNGGSGPTAAFPSTTFSTLSYSYKYLYGNPSHATCTGTTQPGDAGNTFCVDPNHIAKIDTYFTDLQNGTLPSFSFIESGSGLNDEHPGSGQSIIVGEQQVAKVINALMASPEWKDSVFFLSYDEGGGPYDHVPPVPGHSNQNSDPTLGTIPDISTISVNPEDPAGNPNYFPCAPTGSTATLHCDLRANYPGDGSNDAPAVSGFGAQLGFRVPNIIISPFTRKHYVGNKPMDHTAVIKFVENRFINSSAHLTLRDQKQPDLLDFFDFTGAPWKTPPTPPAQTTSGTCNAAQLQ